MKRLNSALAVILSLCALAVAAPRALAGELAGVRMPDAVVRSEQELELRGMALRQKFFFKVYVAGLYVPRSVQEADEVLAMLDPALLEMRFLRSVDADAICKAWYDGLEANTPRAGAQLKAAFSMLCNWMEDMEDGQSMVFSHVPGQGTTVTVKGDIKGVVEGPDFARALFACWVGPNPGPGEEFKRDLLGG
jgi:hypothetical protein